MSNPYDYYPSSPGQTLQGPPPTNGLVNPPAIALIVVSVIGLVGMTIYFVFTMIGLASGVNAIPAAVDEAERVGQAIGYFGVVVIFGLNILLQLLILAAGICMLKRKHYTVCMMGTITAGIPCLGSSCCVLGIPFAIWAFVILLNQDVKATFR
jgi:hypothetical protein